MSDPILTYADLEKRWKPPGTSKAAKQKWIIRRCRAWGIAPIDGNWRGARFRLATVLRREERTDANANLYA